MHTGTKPKKKAAKAILYFAYGSNLDAEQMADRCPAAQAFGAARLPDRRLVFAGYSTSWDGAVATFTEHPGAHLEGLLYRLTPADVAALDYFEGHPYVYERIPCTVLDSRGRRRRALTYWMPPHSLGVSPSPEYFGVIAEAYAKFGFDPQPLVAAANARVL